MQHLMLENLQHSGFKLLKFDQNNIKFRQIYDPKHLNYSSPPITMSPSQTTTVTFTSDGKTMHNACDVIQYCIPKNCGSCY